MSAASAVIAYYERTCAKVTPSSIGLGKLFPAEHFRNAYVILDGEEKLGWLILDLKSSGALHLAYILASEPVRPGRGRRMLGQLCWLADEHGATMTLAVGGSHGTPAELAQAKRLTKWYERHGFVAVAPTLAGVMKRTPSSRS